MKLLKLPKREIFVTEFTLSGPIWVGHLGTEAKNQFLKILRLILAILFCFVLFCRVAEVEVFVKNGGVSKKRRME
jgi:hypothetical protein